MTDESSQRLVIERTLAAPPDLVWRMWTEPEHVAAWYGPGGATVPVARMDVRVGGARLLCMEMETPAGATRMWFGGTYLEIMENSLLVYTDYMSDEKGNALPPEQVGMPAGHPSVTEVRVELAPTDDGGTSLVLTHVGIPADSPGAVGWAMALDALAARLEGRSERL